MQVVENMMVAKFEEEEGRFCVRTRAKERDLSAVGDADGCCGGRLGWQCLWTLSSRPPTRLLAPISCPASPTVPRHSTPPTRTSHCPGALPVANAVATHPTPPPRGQSHGRQRRRAHKSVDGRPECGAGRASWEELVALKAPVCLLPAS